MTRRAQERHAHPFPMQRLPGRMFRWKGDPRGVRGVELELGSDTVGTSNDVGLPSDPLIRQVPSWAIGYNTVGIPSIHATGRLHLGRLEVGDSDWSVTLLLSCTKILSNGSVALTTQPGLQGGNPTPRSGGGGAGFVNAVGLALQGGMISWARWGETAGDPPDAEDALPYVLNDVYELRFSARLGASKLSAVLENVTGGGTSSRVFTHAELPPASAGPLGLIRAGWWFYADVYGFPLRFQGPTVAQEVGFHGYDEDATGGSAATAGDTDWDGGSAATVEWQRVFDCGGVLL